jgi:hypothetical protein
MAKSFFYFRNYSRNLCYDNHPHGFGIPGELFLKIVIAVQECVTILLNNVRAVHSMIYFSHT